MREPEASSDDHVSLLPEKLSPSRLADYNQCPRLFYYKTICKVRTPPTFATLKGTLAHAAFERTFDYPQGERDPHVSATWVDKAWADLTDLDSSRSERDLAQAVEAREVAPPGSDIEQQLLSEAKDMVHLWFEMERVNNFSPTGLTLPGGEEIDGREVYVNSTVSDVPMHGFIDRVDSWQDAAGNTHWAVSDYKGLSIATPLPTATGWTTMGDVVVGDKLLGSSGQEVTVVEKSHVHHRDCYEVRTSDGFSVFADNVHLWEVAVHGLGGPVERAEMVLDTQSIHSLLRQPGVRVFLPRTDVNQTPQLAEFATESPSVADVLADRRWWKVAHTFPLDFREKLLRAAEESASAEAQKLAAQLATIAEHTYDREIISVEPVPSVPTQCVKVDAADSLYLAGEGFLVTHNTGKVPAPRFQDKYFDQLRIYALLVEKQFGIKASVLRLVFTKTGDRDKGILTEIVSDVKLRNLSQRTQKAWESIRQSAESGNWPTKTGPLCNWCFFQQVCPAWADKQT